jgi:hypothetical protein
VIKTSALGLFGVLWALTGTVGLLGFSVVRLAKIATDAFAYDWQGYHWLALGLIVVFMAYAEGYRGFQKSFAPRVAARIRYLGERPRPLWILLAPLFCMGYFHIRKREKIVIYALTIGIILLVTGLRYLAQPWRGIVDVGVVVGLSWGLVATAVFTWRALTAASCPYAPALPSDRVH